MASNKMAILKMFLENPSRSDRTIAKIVGISQPTVTRARHKLIETGMLKSIGVPDLNKIGFSLLAFDLLIEPDAALVVKDPNIILAVKTNQGIQVVSAHKKYRDYVRWSRQYVADSNQTAISCTEEKALKELSFKNLL